MRPGRWAEARSEDSGVPSGSHAALKLVTARLGHDMSHLAEEEARAGIIQLTMFP